MRPRLLFLATILIAASAAFAAAAERHTVIVRDGNTVFVDGNPLHRAYLGVSPLDISPELRDHFGGPKDAGVLVQSVSENSPAAKAGLRVGDLITSIDGTTIDSAWDVSDVMADHKSGDTVKIEFIRGRSRQSVVATVEERDLTPTLRSLRLPPIERELDAMGLPGWRARVEAKDNCGDLQTKIKDLETRLHDLEKKLQK